MPSKRTPINRRQHKKIRTEEMQAMCVRYLELYNAHTLALTDARSVNQLFYSDGRHLELVTLLPEVHRALDIKPWEDAGEIVRAALAELEN